MKSNKNLFSFIHSVILPVAILCSGFFVWHRWDLFVAATKISLLGLLFTSFIGFILLALGAFKFQSLLPFFPVTLLWKEWFGLTAITTFYSKILPARMGFLPRAWYLKKHYKLKLTTYISILSGANILDLVINSLIGIGLLAALMGKDFSTSNLIVAGFLLSLGFGGCGIIAILTAHFFKIKTGIHKIDHLGNVALSALSTFREQPTSLLHYILTSVLLIVAQAISLGSCLYVIDGPTPVSILLIAITAVNLSSVISLTPGNIGITEGMIVAALSLANIPLEFSVSASVLYRVTALLPQMVLGLVYTYILFGRVLSTTEAQSLQKDIA